MTDEEGNRWREPHDHSSAAGAPGASGPGEPGYEGEAMVGDEGAASVTEVFDEPFGRPDLDGDHQGLDTAGTG